MRSATSAAALLTLATLALLWAACVAEQSGAQQAEIDSSPGFFEALLDAEPEPIQVPAGTTVSVRLLDALSSHDTSPGAGFSAEVIQEVSIDGRVAIPTGSIVRGRVTEAHPAKKIGGRAILSIAFDELEIPDAETVALAASLTQAGKSQVARDAAIISGSTIGGAILGEAIDEGDGTTVGAIAGAIGGTIGALKTRGKPVVLPEGTTLHIALERPLTIGARS